MKTKSSIEKLHEATELYLATPTPDTYELQVLSMEFRHLLAEKEGEIHCVDKGYKYGDWLRLKEWTGERYTHRILHAVIDGVCRPTQSNPFFSNAVKLKISHIREID